MFRAAVGGCTSAPFPVAAAAVGDIWGVQVALKHVLCSAGTSSRCLWGLYIRCTGCRETAGTIYIYKKKKSPGSALPQQRKKNLSSISPPDRHTAATTPSVFHVFTPTCHLESCCLFGKPSKNSFNVFLPKVGGSCGEHFIFLSLKASVRRRATILRTIFTRTRLIIPLGINTAVN